MARFSLSPGGAARLGRALARLGLPFRILSLILLTIWSVQILRAPATQILTLEARTQGMVLQFQGPGQQWQINDATLCAPREAAPCQRAPLDFIEWPDGTEISISRPPGRNKVFLRIISDSIPNLPPGTRLEFDDVAFRNNGQQLFRGFVTLGAETGSAREGYLWSASYRFLARDSFAFSTRSAAVSVRSGELVQGDRATVICEGAVRTAHCADQNAAPGSRPMLVFGHLVLELSTDEKPGFDVVLTSGEGDVALRVDRFGIGNIGDAPSEPNRSGWWPFGRDHPVGTALTIRPTLTDRILTSPTFLVLSLLANVIAGLLQPMSANLQSGQTQKGEGRHLPSDNGKPARRTKRKPARNPARPPR